MEKRTQTSTITIRLTPEEKQMLKNKKQSAAAPSMRAFILSMCTEGKVIVNTQLEELNKELRNQGENLNQLLLLARENKIYAADIDELLKIYEKILDALGGIRHGDC